ncbi:MAG: MFS transporter [Gallionellaceae bacterium]|jgi:PPP family 3-phenylpropionic acid transporter|nr:MFS transporter [Gallionellaceae bacterium]
MSSRTNHYWRIAGFYFFYYAFVGMFAPYWSLYLKSLQFGSMSISILMAVQPVMRMVAPGIWGWLAEHTGRRLFIIQMAALGGVITYLGMFFTTQFVGVLLTMALMNFFWSASMPLVEATAFSYLGKHSSRYGRIRSWGSVGFIVTVLGLGYAFDYIAIGWLLWAGFGIMLGIVIFAYQIPHVETVVHHTDHLPIRDIMLQPPVLALFGACFLMAVAHGPYYAFYSIYLDDHGYAKSAVGLLWAVGVLCEIAVFFLMPWLMRHASLPRILALSFACAVLRFLLIGWGVESLALILLAQTLHAATFGSFHAAAVALVHHFFRGRHQSRGQALFGSLTYGAGGMIGMLMSGPLWQHWGATVTYTVSALAALAGWLILRVRLRDI